MGATLDPRRDQFLLFSRFAHLYDAGVPLAEALQLVHGELDRPLRQAVTEIVDDIYRGTAFADALERRRDLFSPETVGVIRAGEMRGELGSAARTVAEGLRGNVLDAAVATADEVDAALEQAAREVEQGEEDGRYIEPGSPLVGALARRAAIDASGEGAFFWRERIVRVAVVSTHLGAAALVRLSRAAEDPPPEAEAWQQGPPRLLLVDGDAALRAVVAKHPGRVVAVGLPAPEAPSVRSVRDALRLRPDAVAVAGLTPEDAVTLGRAGVHAVAWTEDVAAVVKSVGAASLPPPESAVS